MKAKRLRNAKTGTDENTPDATKAHQEETELSTKLEKRRRIEEIFEEKRLQRELESFF